MALINEAQVVLDLAAPDRHAATRVLAETLATTGRATDVEAFLDDVRAREEKMATGLPGGIGIPHARSAAITEPSLVFGRPTEGIDWGAKDGPATLVFLIAAPASGGDAHMQMLPKLAKALMDKEFRASLEAADTPAEVVEIVNSRVSLDEQPASEETKGATPGLHLVAVTSCPTGIAHTYMAAEALEVAAKEAGHTIAVETQGSAGSTPLSRSEIERADAVIFAHDLEVRDKGRFAGKPTIDVGVKKAVSDAPALVERAATAARDGSHVLSVGSSEQPSRSEGEQERASTATKVRQWLMTGVSYMIPFVAAGGILIALSFMLAQVALGEQGAIEITKYALGAEGEYDIANSFSPLSLTSWAALLFVMGGAAFSFLVPILSGYIAFGIADRPGLVPGIVGGWIAATMGAGFLGGLATGFLAGFVARWVSGWKVHAGVRGVMPVVVVPLLSTFITAGLFITVLGRPITWLMDNLTEALQGMGGTSALLLGLVLGAMMGFDLGGPVNKVAYVFATTGLTAAGTATDAIQLKVMAAVMAAGMVAPLAMALATTVRPRLFSEPERENGRAAWLLGASFISEGAIPFAAADPIRVIVGSVVGSAATGAIALAAGVTLRAPHGGIWVLPLMGNFLMFVVALVVGVLVMTTVVVVLKTIGSRTSSAHAGAQQVAA
ncbi:fructose-specific PTS transporter subunit EIIC [Janibacter cremeus]|uniref:PTS fructose transporter subunit IIABC n=1 Tax=Janibacter cremeus TaxID=1285192 RepID=UPI0023F8E22C|nr:fructose-specific PTS transporter subunit EIIC [Janibacter cremeus]WEV76663.1 fructose-specific PTS transporter subunit EIIC [Janibacter cremeus]